MGSVGVEVAVEDHALLTDMSKIGLSESPGMESSSSFDFSEGIDRRSLSHDDDEYNLERGDEDDEQRKSPPSSPLQIQQSSHVSEESSEDELEAEADAEVSAANSNMNVPHDASINHIPTARTADCTLATEATSRNVQDCPDTFDYASPSWRSDKRGAASGDSILSHPDVYDDGDDASIMSGYSYATTDTSESSVQDIISRLQSETDRRRRRLIRRRSMRGSRNSAKDRLKKYSRPVDPKLGITVEIKE